MAKKEIVANVDSIQIEFMDNGYNVRYSGRDADDDWSEVRLVMLNINEVVDHLKIVDAKLKMGV